MGRSHPDQITAQSGSPKIISLRIWISRWNNPKKTFDPKKISKSILAKKVMGVEVNHLGEVFPGSRIELHQLLHQRNYAYVGTICKINLIRQGSRMSLGKG